jgi:ParB family chromosome partitioning protein
VTGKRRALGRGLAALIPSAAPQPPAPPPPMPPAAGGSASAAAAMSTTTVAPAAMPSGRWERPPLPAAPADRRDGLRSVGIEEVHPSREQPRKAFDDAKLDELAASIRAQGLIQPLLVRTRAEGGYQLIAGERRWRAAQRAGLHAVPVVVRDVAAGAAFELAMVENLQREDLNPIEEAEGYQRLIRDFGYTQESLAARVGKDRTTVTNALRLLKLPEAVRGLVVDGRLSMGHARALLGLEDAPAIEQLARRTAAQDLSVRQVETMVRRARTAGEKRGERDADRAPADGGQTTASARDLGLRLSRGLGMRVAVVERDAQSGHLEIHYGSLDQLDGLLRKLLP